MRRVRAILILVLALAMTSAIRGADDSWPRWCGPNGDCTSKEKGLLDKWPEGGPKKLWSVPAGAGYASRVTVEGKLLLFSTVDGKDTLVCLNADDGKPGWSDAGGDRLHRGPSGHAGDAQRRG